MMKYFSCKFTGDLCGWEIRSEDEDEIVTATVKHSSRVHHKVPDIKERQLIRELIRDVDETPAT